MNGAWIDVGVFSLITGIAWLIIGRKRAEPEPLNELALSFIPSNDPSIDGHRFETFERWFRRQVLLARLPFASRMVPLLMVCLAIVLASVVFVGVDSLPLAVFTAVAVIIGCVITLVSIAQWRVREFRKQLPLALDIMAGSVKCGDSLQQAVSLLASTMREPAKTEFVRCRNQLGMGLSLRSTMESLADRIGSFDTRLFATTLAVHRESGGQLTNTLKRMSSVIRSRFEYERHMQVTTGMGRISVVVVVSLAWIIFAYIMIMQPDYGRTLWEKPLGRQLLLAALALEAVGVAWALTVMRAKY